METLYQQVADELKAGIERGVYQTGDRLPGVRTLSKQRNVSIATVITAYRHLEDVGVLGIFPRKRTKASGASAISGLSGSITL